ncbi:MAG: SDR family NAD(P)-dependent oxidoreductase [Candidatus Azotimanducaceae bacterium]
MKHAIVTGAGGDIGACITELAVSRGYRVVAVDVRPNQIDALAYRLDGVVPIVADITDPDSVKKAFDVFDSPLDLLVNNAGLVRFGPLESLAVQDFQDVVNVNLVGSFIVAREAAVRMKATGGGAIVNVTSMGGIHPAPGGGAYGASKAGLAQMTELMSVEWGPYGIRVNAVAPGFIDAGMSAPFFKDEAVREKRTGGVPLGRLGTAADVAQTVLYLGSEEATYITGQEIVIDGGVINSVLAQLPRD